MSTSPLVRSLALGLPRGMVIFAIGVNLPVAGSYSSAESVPPWPTQPPATKTFSRRQQHRDVSYALLLHFPGRLKFAGRWVEEFGRFVKVLITPHAAGHKNLAIREESRAVSRARRPRRRSSVQRTCDGGCRCGNSRGTNSERPSGDGETDDHRADKKFAERFMWVLLEDQTHKNDSREQDDSTGMPRRFTRPPVLSSRSAHTPRCIRPRRSQRP